MKTLFNTFLAAGLICLFGPVSNVSVSAQSLLISEVFVNPSGTDSCKEFVELVATKSIDFSNTPYAVIVCNNGTSTVRGWKEGKAITYAFEITSGSVKAGDIVYVGGSCMKISGTKLRTINNMTTGGDGGLGQANASGVFGNGGSSADGVAIFDMALSKIDSMTAPIDALFYGSTLGTAINSAGAAGYQLPSNDLYSGGKLQSSSYITADPGANYIVASGIYSTVTGTFTTKRTHTTSSTSATDGKSNITMAGAQDTTRPTASISIASGDTTVSTQATIQLVFSEKIRLTAGPTCDNNNIDTLFTLKEKDASGNSVSFDASINGNIITVTPTSAFKSNQVYYFGFNAKAIADSTGNAMSQTNPITFRTLPEQTMFKAGDLAFVAYRMNALTTDDEFAVITFVDILPGTQIQFTDAKFTTNTPAQCAGGLTWTAPASGVASGTVISIKNDLPSVNIGTLTGTKFGLSSSGDQVMVYTGSNTNPTHITALSSNQWLSTNTICSGSNSMLPSALTNASNAIQHALTKGGTGLNTANAYYTGTMKGSIAQLKALIHDTANWNGAPSGSAAQTWPTWTFPGSPSVTKAELLSATTVRVIFSADMDYTSATTLSNYGGINNLTNATMTNNGASIDTVLLTYSVPFTSGQSYTLTVSNAKDAEQRKLFTPYSFTFNFNAEFAFATRFVVAKESSSTATVRVSMKFPGTGSVKLTPRFAPFSTALSGDHTFSSTTVTFNSSTPFVDVTIPIFNDKLAEQDEYLNILMESPTGGVIAGLPFVTLYIQDDDRAIINPARNIELNHVESFDPNPTLGSTCEIVVHDAKSQRLFMTSAIQKRMDIADFSNPKDITLVKSIDMTPYGGITSIAVKNDVVAVASPNANEQLDGQVIFFNTNGDFISKVTVGALPDMITFTPDGKKVLTANEGQPSLDYTVDPEGSISVIDLSVGAANLTQAQVKTIDFKSWNAGEADLKAKGVRKLNASSSLAQDFEPEYITVAPDNIKAWVTLQENNAIAELDLSNNTVSSIWAMGTKNMNANGNGFDASDKSGSILLANWPVKSFYIPDGIANYSVNNKTYLVTANEGDEKEYTTLNERTTVSAVILDPAKFPQGDMLKEDHALGRFRVTNLHGDTDGDGDFDELYSVGSRSFSIWDPSTKSLVWDGGDQFEWITSKHPAVSRIFNADNENNTLKGRSRAKGPEPEGVTVAEINSKQFAFVALERTGGVMVYDVTNPTAPVFEDYQNTRSNTAYTGDLGPEGIQFINNANSPTGKPYVIVANEISGTITVFEVINNTLVSEVTETTQINSRLLAYPNPTMDRLFVQGIGSITLTDMTGKVVFQGAINNDGLDVSQIAKGIYLAKDATGRTAKVVIK
ncbi:MAG: hypothetical protein RLZZ465_492 [Bacteroidota bacterium]